MAVCGDMLEVIVNALNSPSAQTGSTSSQESQSGKRKQSPRHLIEKQNLYMQSLCRLFSVDSTVCDGENTRIQIKKPWVGCLAENKRKWKEQATKGTLVLDLPPCSVSKDQTKQEATILKRTREPVLLKILLHS